MRYPMLDEQDHDQMSTYALLERAAYEDDDVSVIDPWDAIESAVDEAYEEASSEALIVVTSEDRVFHELYEDVALLDTPAAAILTAIAIDFAGDLS